MASWRGSRNWHEFEDKSACDKAYKKMDKTLIDDRRIHVDFSQSASKLGIQYKHKGGRGCFKCGSPDYIAKVSAKYIVKDESASKKGGDDGSSRLNVSIYKR